MLSQGSVVFVAKSEAAAELAEESYELASANCKHCTVNTHAEEKTHNLPEGSAQSTNRKRKRTTKDMQHSLHESRVPECSASCVHSESAVLNPM